MRARTVFEVADESGRWVISDRFFGKDKSLDQPMLDFIENRINKIEVETEAINNRSWVKPLKGVNGLWEIRVNQNKKAVRIFFCFDGDNIIALAGCSKEKGGDKATIARAQDLKAKWELKKLKKRVLPNDYRI